MVKWAALVMSLNPCCPVARYRTATAIMMLIKVDAAMNRVVGLLNKEAKLNLAFGWSLGREIIVCA